MTNETAVQERTDACRLVALLGGHAVVEIPFRSEFLLPYHYQKLLPIPGVLLYQSFDMPRHESECRDSGHCIKRRAVLISNIELAIVAGMVRVIPRKPTGVYVMERDGAILRECVLIPF